MYYDCQEDEQSQSIKPIILKEGRRSCGAPVLPPCGLQMIAAPECRWLMVSIAMMILGIYLI